MINTTTKKWYCNRNLGHHGQITMPNCSHAYTSGRNPTRANLWGKLLRWFEGSHPLCGKKLGCPDTRELQTTSPRDILQQQTPCGNEGNKPFKYKLISSTLKDEALEQHMSLPQYFVLEYAYLSSKLVHKFSVSKHQKMLLTSLFNDPLVTLKF